MSGYEILTPSAGSTDWTSFNTQVTYQRKGFMEINLNEYDTTGDPSVAAGGLVEVAGALFYFGDTEVITGTASTSNLNYIRLSASSSSITPEYTTDAPTWIPSKNGYYDSSTGLMRYVGGCNISLGEKWIYRTPYEHRDIRVSGSFRPLKTKILEIGVWDMETDFQVAIDPGTDVVLSRIRNVTAIVAGDAETDWFPLDVAQSATIGSKRGGPYYWNAGTGILLIRTSGLAFDSAGFSSTTINRGWITITYED